MENTPTGCDSDLPAILLMFKHGAKSRSVFCLQRLAFDPSNIKISFTSQSSAQLNHVKTKLGEFACVHRLRFDDIIFVRHLSRLYKI